MIPVEGGEFSSTMENGVRAFVHKRTFDETTKVKLRVRSAPPPPPLLLSFVDELREGSGRYNIIINIR